MKKIYQIVMLCAMVVALASCGGSTGASTNYEDSVNIALEDRDFVKAYRFASKCGMTKTVVSKEAAYVLEEQGEAGLVRIAMIVNEHKAPEIYLDLLKMAISMDNEQLATKIYKMSDACDEQSLDYAVTADMEGLVSTFLSKNPSCIDKQNVIEYLKEKGTYNKLYSEIEKKRHEEKTAELNKKIDTLASEVFPTRPALGMVKSNSYGEMPPEYTSYRTRVDNFNADCRRLLAETIKEKNLPCAKKVAAMAKTSIAWNNLGDWVQVVEKHRDHSSLYEAYKVIDDNSEKKAIQQLLNEAIRNGNFN